MWLPKFTSTWKGESRKQRRKLFGYDEGTEHVVRPYQRKFGFHPPQPQ